MHECLYCRQSVHPLSIGQVGTHNTNLWVSATPKKVPHHFWRTEQRRSRRLRQILVKKRVKLFDQLGSQSWEEKGRKRSATPNHLGGWGWQRNGLGCASVPIMGGSSAVRRARLHKRLATTKPACGGGRGASWDAGLRCRLPFTAIRVPLGLLFRVYHVCLCGCLVEPKKNQFQFPPLLSRHAHKLRFGVAKLRAILARKMPFRTAFRTIPSRVLLPA